MMMENANENPLSKFALSNEMYQLFFDINNAFAIFRAENIVCFRRFGDAMLNDALVDILYSARSGELELYANDIVCIKLNGTFTDYCFIGSPRCSALDAGAVFVKADNSVEKERDRYVSALHDANNVLDIFNGTIISLKSCGIGRQYFYCIDKEAFGNSNEKIPSGYCLYSMDCTGGDGIVIKNINPFSRPFNSVKTAFYYFDKCKDAKLSYDKRKSAALLLNRQELGMVKDYMQLRNAI